MRAPILAILPEHPQPRVIDRAVSLLEAGELIVYPTDSYYGIGCDLFNKKALDKLYRVKGRDRRKPFAFVVPDLSEVARYAKVSNFAYRALRHLTPGPYTFILEATRLVPSVMQTRQKEVGIRVPESAVARALAERLGRPIVSTSATDPHGEPLISAGDVQDTLSHAVSLILDSGVLQNEPSTVISLVGDRVEILRQGKGDVSELLGRG